MPGDTCRHEQQAEKMIARAAGLGGLRSPRGWALYLFKRSCTLGLRAR